MKRERCWNEESQFYATEKETLLTRNTKKQFEKRLCLKLESICRLRVNKMFTWVFGFCPRIVLGTWDLDHRYWKGVGHYW